MQITRKVSKKNLDEPVHPEKKTQFFQKTILQWFRKNKRDYPWRMETDPYKILIAEIMLQRTRVDQVLPVYSSFIERFPKVQSLARADVDKISEFVSKLGLFWRSKLMSDMARALISDYGGTVPKERKELLQIPGIGDYIADAMISFAFDGKRTVIDSNVIRLVSRFFGIQIRGEMRRKKEFVDFCQKLSVGLKNDDVKNLNWAMIDHAASVCRPEPCCVKCPLSSGCHYFNERGLIVSRQ